MRYTVVVNTIIFCAALVLADSASAQETIHPAGYNINSSYAFSVTQVYTGDTLTINWSVVNDEDFGISDLYLTENLPSDFTLISYSLSIDGSAISHYSWGPLPGEIYVDYDAYRWAIDIPDSGDSLNRVLAPAESLSLTIEVSCSETGEYIFPFHGWCGYGSGTGLFTTADPCTLQVLPELRVLEDPPALPRDPFFSFAYPNPFNSDVIIALSGIDNPGSPILLKIYDLLGREVLSREIRDYKENSLFYWRPQKDIASGPYFYNIIVNNTVSGGKITFLR